MTTDNEMLSDAARRLPAARAALQRAVGDMPASGQQGGSSGVSDRTGRIALTVIDGSDSAWTDTRTLDQLMATMSHRCRNGQPITRQLATLIDLLDRWAPHPKRRNAIHTNLRAAADDLLNKTDDHNNCRSCKRHPGAWGDPHARGLCKTCDRWVARITELYDVTIELPPVALVALAAARGAGTKITDRDIHNTMHGTPRRD